MKELLAVALILTATFTGIYIGVQLNGNLAIPQNSHPAKE